MGISPGTRYTGFSVFCGPELRDWGVKNRTVIGHRDRLDGFTSVILGLIGQYGVNVLSLKRLHPSRSSLNLDRLVREIRSGAMDMGLRVCQYSIDELKLFFCSDDRTNKVDMMETLALRYPVLSYELDRERAVINPYHVRMFEAVALGSACFYELDGRN